jgi:ketosteroid isomerase-like protein
LASDLDTLKLAYEALNRGDISAALDVLDSQAEWNEHSELPEASSYHGKETIRTFLESFLESWQEFHQEPEDLVAEGDKVAIMLHLSARGKGSGVSVESRYAHVWTMRAGKGVRVDAYDDASKALEALHEPARPTATTLDTNPR